MAIRYEAYDHLVISNPDQAQEPKTTSMSFVLVAGAPALGLFPADFLGMNLCQKGSKHNFNMDTDSEYGHYRQKLESVVPQCSSLV